MTTFVDNGIARAAVNGDILIKVLSFFPMQRHGHFY
jgi:hypothetical protein